MNGISARFMKKIGNEFENSIQIKKLVLEQNLPVLSRIAELMTNALREGNKIMLFGNGGSAADSQHLAAEFINRFKLERPAMPAIALTTDTSVMTAIANDYCYENIFSRQIEAIGQVGDVAIGFTTSGSSGNVIKAIITANEMGITTVGFTGLDGGKVKECSEVCLQVPSNSTPRIQEVHITAGHALCEVVEHELFQKTGRALGISRNMDSKSTAKSTKKQIPGKAVYTNEGTSTGQ